MHTTFIQPFVHHSYCLKSICDDRTSNAKTLDHYFVFYSPDRDSSLAGKEYMMVIVAKAKALAGVAAEAKAVRPAQEAMDGSSVGTSVDGALDGVSSDSGEANVGESDGDRSGGPGLGGEAGHAGSGDRLEVCC